MFDNINVFALGGMFMYFLCNVFFFQGVPGNGELTSTDPLVKILTSVIFICSVAHAGANFPQYDNYCYPPNYPALMRGSPPTSKVSCVSYYKRSEYHCKIWIRGYSNKNEIEYEMKSRHQCVKTLSTQR